MTIDDGDDDDEFKVNSNVRLSVFRIFVNESQLSEKLV